MTDTRRRTHSRGLSRGSVQLKPAEALAAIPAHLNVKAAGAAPGEEVKSPRSQLLDRIRTTPRTSNFVPGDAPAAGGARQQRSTSRTHARTPSVADIAALEQQKQQLIMQNMLLAKQQMLMQHQQQQQQQHSAQMYASMGTPPYTPEASPISTTIVNTQNTQLFYDTNSCRYVQATYDASGVPTFSQATQEQVLHWQLQQQMMYAASASASVKTPTSTSKHGSRVASSTGLATPDSTDRRRKPSISFAPMEKQGSQASVASSVGSSFALRTSTPPKDGHPQRQPRGPPPVDELVAAAAQSSHVDDLINFAARRRRKARSVLELGLLRRSTPEPIDTLSSKLSLAL
ncbi:hypothetical protein PYCC9005_005216 [Savitreella phatthalungensis]